MSLWRADFPALRDEAYAYLDSAATAHKPQIVLDSMTRAMAGDYASVSRGVYRAAQNMTAEYESARASLAEFIHAKSEEIIFTRNATEGFNLLATCLSHGLTAGDQIVITHMEHHANIVPWQMVAERMGAQIVVWPILDSGDLDPAFEIPARAKIVSFTAMSNALGTINDVPALVCQVRVQAPKAHILVDATQAVVHGPIDVRAWGADALVFTGHKLYGPTGIGVLWGRADVLNALPPFQGGGDMIAQVSFEHGTTYRDAPHKFEAGTPHFIGAIGLARAAQYVNNIGWSAIMAYEAELTRHLLLALTAVKGVQIIGAPNKRGGIVPFVLEGCHPQDVAMILDQKNVAVRVGHHCAMPLMERLGHMAMIRASLGLYNTIEDINRLAEALNIAKRMLNP